MDDKILEMKKAEADKGWTEQPRLLTKEDVQRYNLTRTIGVMEWRDHSQAERVRMVDHSTESWINDATSTGGQKLQSDRLETLMWLVLLFMYMGVMPLLFKADVESVFRKCPLKPAHFQYAAAVFVAEGQAWIAEQRVCPFGAVASVWSFHRVGNWMLSWLRLTCVWWCASAWTIFMEFKKKDLAPKPLNGCRSVLTLLVCRWTARIQKHL